MMGAMNNSRPSDQLSLFPAAGNVPDRFENQEVMLHERVRRAFLDIAEEEPDRCVVVDASQPEAMVAGLAGDIAPFRPAERRSAIGT